MRGAVGLERCCWRRRTGADVDGDFADQWIELASGVWGEPLPPSQPVGILAWVGPVRVGPCTLA